MYLYMHYIHTCMCVYMCIYIYIYTFRISRFTLGLCCASRSGETETHAAPTYLRNTHMSVCLAVGDILLR